MLKLGVNNTDKIKEQFLEKFQEQREDASEYEFGTIVGEQMKTEVLHKVCGNTFETRPYLFLQEKFPKRCPYCHSKKKRKLTTEDIKERVHDASEGRIILKKHEEEYQGRQKHHIIQMECLDCGHEFEKNFQNVKGNLRCPQCRNKTSRP